MDLKQKVVYVLGAVMLLGVLLLIGLLLTAVNAVLEAL